ncbi:MAG: cupredoxin domain-containing protein [Kofleriaceae bacterium]|jgi:plastocyanin domain-containing protein|nr:cupredoxin domain-containing protein [Kofleriaceae bacterium]
MTGIKTLFFVVGVVLVAGAAACKKEDSSADPKARGKGGAPANRIAISVTEDGFEPNDIKVNKGEPITFVFERKTDETCAKEVIVHVDDGNKIERKLPLNQPVEVAVTFPKSGDITYACGMDMVKGSIHVQ